MTSECIRYTEGAAYCYCMDIVYAACEGLTGQTDRMTIVIAERSEANNRDLWASKSQLAFIHILHMSARFVSHAPRLRGGKARV